jgi:hypothetical protein
LAILPEPNGRSLMIEEDQKVSDIMTLILHAHKENAKFYDQIAAQFWTGDIYTTCENLFNFCKKNILYEIESEDYQTVRSPQRILQEGYGDCKHYASFIGGCLSALQRCGHKINWVYRFAAYKILTSIPGHVFIVVFDQGEEIWIDPVLNYFNEHKSYTNKVDKKIPPGVNTSLGKIGCNCSSNVGCNNLACKDEQHTLGAGYGYKNRGYLGDTKQDFQIGGSALLAVAAPLAVIPVVGWIGGAVIGAVGGIMSLVGGLLNDWKTSSQVRWLTQLYQFYVLGQNVTSYDKVNENYTGAAQAWFYVVLGVPIYDRVRFNSIRNVSHNIPLSKSGAVAEYLSYSDTKTVDPLGAAHAYDIAQTMALNGVPGSWADMTAANIIAPVAPAPTSNVQVLAPTVIGPISESSVPLSPAQASISSIPSWVWIAAIGVGAYLLID